jgi:hypothetical protein
MQLATIPFLQGLWNGFKAIPVAIWNLVPAHPFNTVGHIGYLIGMLLFILVVVLIINRLLHRLR